MYLSDEEKAILGGEEGMAKKKALETLIRYGEAFGAERLIKAKRGHVVMPTAASFLPCYLEILQQMVKEGLEFQVPTSINPRTFEKDRPGLVAKLIYNRQEEFEKVINRLGIIPCYTCAPYLKDNIPKSGEVLAWAESSAVVYANSVIGARTNRNSSVVEICSAILGKTPEYGLLLDENRKADYLIEVETEVKSFSLLGFLVGQKVGEKVPYYAGIPQNISAGDLKDLGAASAASGAVGLFHVEGVTPEAKEKGRKLLKENHEVLRITEADLEATKVKLSMEGRPDLIIIGCPHLALEQLFLWAERIERPVKVETWLVTAPNILREFRDTREYKRLLDNKVKMMTLCSLGFMETPKLRRIKVLTNSGKLAYYTAACFGYDEECLQAMYGRD